MQSLTSTGSAELNTNGSQLWWQFWFLFSKAKRHILNFKTELSWIQFLCFGHLNLKRPKLPTHLMQVTKQHCGDGGFILCDRPPACAEQLRFNRLQVLRVTISCMGEIMEKLKSAACCLNLTGRVLWSTSVCFSFWLTGSLAFKNVSLVLQENNTYSLVNGNLRHLCLLNELWSLWTLLTSVFSSITKTIYISSLSGSFAFEE